MDPPRKGANVLFAPPPEGGGVLSFPPAAPPPRSKPPIQQHLVVPEVTRDEVLRGRKITAQPALAPHGDAHADLGGVLRWHVRDGYQASIDLLTRASEGSDFATDLSIRRAGDDPATGERYLEELSFEIVNEQSPRDVREKAEELVQRGVRRVFAVFVKNHTVSEWSREKNDFVTLDKDGRIEDPCLVRPIAVRALLDAATAEREAVRALKERGSPEIVAIKEEGRIEGRREGHREGRIEGRREGRIEGQREGKIEGQRETLLELLEERFGEVPEGRRALIEAASGETLAAWLKRLLSATTLDGVFGEP
jgi:hypothetical protein